MTLAEKIKIKRTDFAQALERLTLVLMEYRANPKSIIAQAAVVQYFEIVSELGWKTLRDILLNEGLGDLNTPRIVLKEALVTGYISDGDAWMQVIQDRNKTSHIYNENIAQSVLNHIDTDYEKLFNDLKAVFDAYEIRS